MLGVELLARGVNIRRVHAEVDGRGIGLRLGQCVVRGREDLGVYFVMDRLERLLREVTLFDEPLRERGDGVPRGVGVPLILRSVHHLVVRQ